MTAMTIGELVGYIRADNTDFERGLASSQLRMEGFRLDTNGRLRDLRGRFVDAGQVMERALTGVGDEMGEAARQTVVYSSVVDAEMRTMEGRMRAVRQAAERMGESLTSRLQRVTAGLRGMNVDTDRLKSAGATFGKIAMSVGGVAAKLGAAVPLAASLVGTLVQIAPAAAVAATGVLALQLATQAFKLGMVGVSDAVSAAMDPSDPAAFEEALKKLAPSARSFAREVRALQPQFKAMQQSVQQNLFKGLDVVLRDLGASTLPILKQQLGEAATSLNYMAKGVGAAAVEMSENGVLGKALLGANTGLANLTQAPGQFVTALMQVAAAAAPAFGRITEALGAGLSQASEQVTAAYGSGAMEGAINQAVSLIGQLGQVAGNVFSIIGSVFGAAQASGGGFIGTLQQITASLAAAFASPAVQSGLQAIFQTMATLATTIGPLLTMALQAIAPVFTALGPPVQRLIQMLGTALEPIIRALGPVLEAVAVAVGAFLDALSPLLPVIGDLIGQLLPALMPLLTFVADVFKAIAPLVSQLATILMSALSPILAALVPVLQPIIDALLVLIQAVLPIITAQAAAFAPIVAKLAEMFAELMVALGPVIEALILLVADVLTALMPVILPVIDVIAKLAGLLADGLGQAITLIVVPAIQMITQLLRGDFSGAWATAKQLVKNVIDQFMQLFRELPGRAAVALAGLAMALWGRIQEAGGRMVSGAREKVSEVIGQIRALPGQAVNALGNLGSLLWNAGSRLVSGFIDGITSAFGKVKSTLGRLTSMLPDWKGPATLDARILTPAGVSLIEGFRRGITQATPGLQSQLGGLTGALPGMVPGGPGGAAGGAGGGRLIVELAGPDSFKAVIRRIVQVDGRGNVQTAFG
ncbi:hypothetical protein [Streptomyces sp. NPDC058674]|uniref:phage tail protein n=1 Tax=Streptomyces sp. NPDC058674 TaxID=3346592 RepID=UPI00364C606D